MSTLKKLFSNIKSSKDKDCSEPDPLTQARLKRSNAKLAKKHNKSYESLVAVDFIQHGANLLPSTTTKRAAVPDPMWKPSRSYSFEAGASVEDFKTELETHSKRPQRKPKRQNTDDSVGSSSPKPKFGLKINNAKLPSAGLKAASTLDLPVRLPDTNSAAGTKPVYGRYGLAVHPDNIGGGVIKGGCWQPIPTPPLSTAKPAPATRSPSPTNDPFVDAKIVSEKWNGGSPFQKKAEPLSSGTTSIQSVEEEASESAIRDSFVASSSGHMSLTPHAFGAKDAIHNFKGSPVDSAISFDIGLSKPLSDNAEKAVRSGWKGKERQIVVPEEQGLPSMPGSFPVPELLETFEASQNKQSNERKSKCDTAPVNRQLFQHTTTPSSILAEGFQAQLERMKELDQEKADREEAKRVEAEFKQQQEEEDRLAAEEADRRSKAEAARLAEEEARQRLRECVACADSKDPFDFPAKPPTADCEHEVHTCLECLQSWMASEFETKGCDDIKCPECPKTLQYSDVQLAASTETFGAYDKLTIRNALGALDEFAWCLGAGCGSGQLNIGNNDFMHCVNCGYKQCLKHKVAWHQGETCKQYEYRTSGKKARDEERATEKMIDSVSKKCPGKNCGWRIQKTDGCEHMTCKKCKHQFCWQCLAPQTEIKRVGNTAHAKTCKFHSTNLDLAYPFNMH